MVWDWARTFNGLGRNGPHSFNGVGGWDNMDGTGDKVGVMKGGIYHPAAHPALILHHPAPSCTTPHRPPAPIPHLPRHLPAPSQGGAARCRMMQDGCRRVLQDGAEWCRMGAGWCRMAQDGAGWCRMGAGGRCRMVQDGAGCRVQDGAAQCSMVQGNPPHMASALSLPSRYSLPLSSPSPTAIWV